MRHDLRCPGALAALLAVAGACGSQPDAPRTPRLIGGRPAPADAPTRGPATCLPPGDGWGVPHQLGRVGPDLVVCVSAHAALRGCWTLEPATGAVFARATAPVPGAGFPVKDGCHQGLCAPATTPRDPDQDPARFVLHPDGKRAAVLDGGRVTVLDVASRQVLTSFPLRGDQAGDEQLSNAATNLWFVGETIYIRGDDAGPAAVLIRYDLTGKARSALRGLYLGGVGVADRALVVQEDALRTIQVEDGVRVGPARTRQVPDGPCAIEGHVEWEAFDDDPERAACLAYLERYYRPYDGAQLVPDGKDLVGFTGAEVFVLDGATLAEKRRVAVARCADAPAGD